MHSESHVCFCSIIPSSILTRLSTSGDAALAEAAARTIRITSSLRFPRTIEHRRTVARGCYTYGSATPGVQM
jgi:hypothetical protein